MFMMIFYFSRVTDLTYAKSAPGGFKRFRASIYFAIVGGQLAVR